MTEHVVIIGGGTGGAVLAKDPADRLEPELHDGDVRVTLVNADPDHVYSDRWRILEIALHYIPKNNKY